TQRQRAEAKALESLSRLVRQYVANGNRLVESGDLPAALLWFAQVLKEEQNDSARAEIHRMRLACTILQCPKPTQCWFHSNKVNSAQFSPDATRVVTACEDRSARVWDVTTGKLVTDAMKHPSPVLHAEFSKDGHWILTACEQGARVWNAGTGQPRT